MIDPVLRLIEFCEAVAMTDAYRPDVDHDY